MCDSRQPANGADSSSSPTIDWPKSWTADDIAWVKRQVVAAARDEGRREAVKRINETIGSRHARTYEEVTRVIDEVNEWAHGLAGLNASESPPTCTILEPHEHDGVASTGPCWRNPMYRGDASESPPTSARDPIHAWHEDNDERPDASESPPTDEHIIVADTLEAAEVAIFGPEEAARRRDASESPPTFDHKPTGTVCGICASRDASESPPEES